MKKIYTDYLIYMACFVLFCTGTLYSKGEQIVSEGFIIGALLTSLSSIVATLVIGALLIYWLIKENMSFNKALLMSFVANAASAFVGIAVMLLIGMPAGEPGSPFKFSVNYEFIRNYLLMYFSSALIELGILMLIFKYSAKQLWLPVFLGNLVTYGVILAHMFPEKIIMLLGYWH